MISIQSMQTLFMNAIFENLEKPVATNELGKHLTYNERLSVDEQISIYRDSVFGGLIMALQEIYPVCHKLVGQDFFDFMATQYINKHQSLSPDLTDYGEHLANFISHFKQADSLLYLSDVACLEWAWHRAFHARDHSGLNINKLNFLSEEQQENLVFKLPPGSALISSDYPIHKIWNANQQGNENDDVIDLDEGSVKLLVWRKKFDMHIDLLQEDEWAFLNKINQQEKFNYICETDEQSLDIALLLPQCVKQGWIADFYIFE